MRSCSWRRATGRSSRPQFIDGSAGMRAISAYCRPCAPGRRSTASPGRPGTARPEAAAPRSRSRPQAPPRAGPGPARVAGVDAPLSYDIGQLLQIDIRRGEPDVGDHDPGRGLRVGELREQDQGLRLHGPADVDGPAPGDIGELRHDVVDHGVGGTVEDDPHRPLLVVLRDEHHVRAKLGSIKVGEAISSCPRSESSVVTILPPRPPARAAGGQLSSRHGVRRQRERLRGARHRALARGPRGGRLLGRVVRALPRGRPGARGRGRARARARSSSPRWTPKQPKPRGELSDPRHSGREGVSRRQRCGRVHRGRPARSGRALPGHDRPLSRRPAGRGRR